MQQNTNYPINYHLFHHQQAETVVEEKRMLFI
jgi:hypothetical protein